MMRLAEITAVEVALLVVAVTGLWMTVPLNVPCCSMLQ